MFPAPSWVTFHLLSQPPATAHSKGRAGVHTFTPENWIQGVRKREKQGKYLLSRNSGTTPPSTETGETDRAIARLLTLLGHEGKPLPTARQGQTHLWAPMEGKSQGQNH